MFAKRRNRIFVTGVCLIALIFSNCQKQEKKEEAEESWPDEVTLVHITSTVDGAEQPAIFWVPEAAKQGSEVAQPLLVALHTWSFGYEQVNLHPFNQCKKEDWTFISPHFRGPNKNPDACGSPLVIQDILDAVDYAKSHANVDENRIYLAGGSGGGYATLLMAGKAPEIWAAAAAWCPITHLASWHQESKELGTKYFEHLESVCGGAPGMSEEVDRQYRERSAITHLDNAKGLPIDIHTGIHDGHKGKGSVPISHSLNAFNLLAEINGYGDKKISEEQINTFVDKEMVPEELADERGEEDIDSEKPILFQRTAGQVRIIIFDGGHEGLPEKSFEWLAEQSKAD